MDIDAFESDAPGRLVPIAGPDYEHFAYVPDPLPGEVRLSAFIQARMSEADRAVGRLDLSSQRLANPLMLVRPTLIREAVSTSALEGTYAPFRDVLEAEIMDEKTTTSEIHEIMNYIRAALTGFELVKDRPVRFSVLCDLQRILVKGTRGDRADSGALRSGQVFIGESRKAIVDSRFVPPPPGILLEDGVRAWEEWINGEHDIPLLIKLALGHYQFETLHPFSDGNGRLGRLILMLQLISAGELAYPIFNIAPYFDRYKQEYKDLMLRSSQTGDFDPWLEFFFEAIKHQSVDSADRVNRLIKTRDEIRNHIRSEGGKGKIIELVEMLPESPVVSASLISKSLNTSAVTSHRLIEKLEGYGYLKRITQADYDKRYICEQIASIIE